MKWHEVGEWDEWDEKENGEEATLLPRLFYFTSGYNSSTRLNVCSRHVAPRSRNINEQLHSMCVCL